jgi:hypothetical protein
MDVRARGLDIIILWRLGGVNYECFMRNASTKLKIIIK